MVTEGKHKTLMLRHGTSMREFHDVEIRKIDDDRYELTGVELKSEAYPTDAVIAPLRVVEIEVTVGFLAENVIE